MFIVLEGVDSSGKGTQSRLLAEELNAALFSFPAYDTVVGQLLDGWLKHKWFSRVTCTRGMFVLDEQTSEDLHKFDTDHPLIDPFVFQCLMILNQYEIAPQIQKAIDRGQNVVCDRWCMSAFIYGQEACLDQKYLESLAAFLPKPDLHILLSVNPEVAGKRRIARDRHESDLEAMKRRSQLYKEYWNSHEEEGQWKIVDGEGTIQEVHQRILKTVG